MPIVTADTARPPKAPQKRSAAQLPSSAAPTIFVNHDDPDNIARSARVQLLSRKNIPESRLGLLASLIWEVADARY